MKKNLLLSAVILIITTLLVGCWCPVGNPWDYEDIEGNNYYSAEPYPLSSGKGYHGEPKLSKNINGSGDSYKFIAEANVHCQFAVKFYRSEHNLEVKIDGKEVKNPENGFNVPEGSELVIYLNTKFYLRSGTPSSFAEFYLYVD